MALLNRPPKIAEELDLEQIVNIEEAGAQSVIDIVIVVGNIVSNGRDLRLQRGVLSKREWIGIV